MKKYIIFFFLISQLFPLGAREDQLDQLVVKIDKMVDDSAKVMAYIDASELSDDVLKKIKWIHRGFRVAGKIDWKEGQGITCYYMAWIYLYCNNNEAATEYFKKAEEYSDNISIKVNSLGVISNLYSWNKDHDQAIEYAKMALGKVDTTSVNKDAYIEALMFMGDAYRYSLDTDNERDTYLKAFSLTRATSLSAYQFNRFFIYLYLNQTAIEDPAQSLNFAFYAMNLWDKSSRLEKYQYGLSYLKVIAAYTTSMENQKIKQLQLDAEVKQRKIYIVGIVILLLLSILLIWQSYSRNKVIKELAKANEVKSRFFGILNHDLRRPVAGLISYLQLKTIAPEVITPEEVVNFDKKTMETAKNLLENMEDLLFWCKDQMQSFEPDFSMVAVSKLFDDTRSFFEYDDNIDIGFYNEDNIQLKTDENYVKTIMRNLTSNAISATSKLENPEIVWSSRKKGDKVILSIYNNGGKISQDKIDIILNNHTDINIKEGLGLKIICDLANSINCQIGIDTDECSTTFSLIFNI